jgi:hypothetical protein
VSTCSHGTDASSLAGSVDTVSSLRGAANLDGLSSILAAASALQGDFPLLSPQPVSPPSLPTPPPRGSSSPPMAVVPPSDAPNYVEPTVIGEIADYQIVHVVLEKKPLTAGRPASPLGVEFRRERDLPSFFDLPSEEAATDPCISVVSVQPNSTSAHCGLLPGDLLCEPVSGVDGQTFGMLTEDRLRDKLANLAGKGPVDCYVLRRFGCKPAAISAEWKSAVEIDDSTILSTAASTAASTVVSKQSRSSLGTVEAKPPKAKHGKGCTPPQNINVVTLQMLCDQGSTRHSLDEEKAPDGSPYYSAPHNNVALHILYSVVKRKGLNVKLPVQTMPPESQLIMPELPEEHAPGTQWSYSAARAKAKKQKQESNQSFSEAAAPTSAAGSPSDNGSLPESREQQQAEEYVAKADLLPNDVILKFGGFDQGVYRQCLEEWWERYEFTANCDKRKFVKIIVDDMFRRGVRFLSRADEVTAATTTGSAAAGAAGCNGKDVVLLKVEGPDCADIHKKVLRAARREVVTRTHHLSNEQRHSREALIAHARSMKYLR